MTKKVSNDQKTPVVDFSTHPQGINNPQGNQSTFCRNFPRQVFYLTAGSDVGEPDFIGECGDKFVPACGEGAGDAMLAPEIGRAHV